MISSCKAHQDLTPRIHAALVPICQTSSNSGDNGEEDRRMLSIIYWDIMSGHLSTKAAQIVQKEDLSVSVSNCGQSCCSALAFLEMKPLIDAAISPLLSDSRAADQRLRDEVCQKLHSQFYGSANGSLESVMRAIRNFMAHDLYLFLPW